MNRIDGLASAGSETPLEGLSKSYALLKLAVGAPDRFVTWDAIVLTASSEEQARLYRRHLEEVRVRGLIAAATRTVVVADPGGMRIGSGGATLHALRVLAQEYSAEAVGGWRVLLVHAGGDSRRVPWANVFGKCFIPFPLLADPDQAVPTLFDHQLAVAAPLAGRMPGAGLVSLAGDVLPLLNTSRVGLVADGAVVVTAAESLDVAGRHGVIVADGDGRVVDLLQKADPETLAARGALVGGGAALLDTGIYAFCGEVYRRLVGLAGETPDPVVELVASRRECSLYEEIASALVASRREWVQGRPLGPRLVGALGEGVLWNRTVPELYFVHLGTTAEILNHFSLNWEGRIGRVVSADVAGALGSAAVVCATTAGRETTVGDNSFLYGCRLTGETAVGSRCVVMGVHSRGLLRVPPNLCVWQLPLRRRGKGARRFASVCCGVDDCPKDEWTAGTFCNREFAGWMRSHGVEADELWGAGVARTLWHARLFARVGADDGLVVLGWLWGDGTKGGEGAALWRGAERLSLAELHAEVDFGEVAERLARVQDGLILDIMERTVRHGMNRNVRALMGQASPAVRRTKAWRGVVSAAEGCVEGGGSRSLQVAADLFLADGRADEAAAAERKAFEAIGREVGRYVKSYEAVRVSDLVPGTVEETCLPVRFDLAGGWSDTPPYCLENPARVLNMAVEFGGRRPVMARVTALAEREWRFYQEDTGLVEVVRPGEGTGVTSSLSDPFVLLKAALQLTGYGAGRGIHQGVEVRTHTGVPKGSGLGTSSILGAALVSALQKLAGRRCDAEPVSELVLVLEQRITTGGGWQDQVGGLMPGVKCITSAPVQPMRLVIEPVPLLRETAVELESRLVIAYTGLDRLAKNVLQIVVGRYLRRERRALNAVRRLVELADEGREALVLGRLDDVGRVMEEVWRVHQELDPHCSNAGVDAMFDKVADLASGWKLAGAGGGGFMGVLGKDPEAAERIRRTLAGLGAGVKVYDWRLAT